MHDQVAFRDDARTPSWSTVLPSRGKRRTRERTADGFWTRRGDDPRLQLTPSVARRMRQQLRELIVTIGERRPVEALAAVRTLSQLTQAIDAPGLTALLSAVAADTLAADWSVALVRAQSSIPYFRAVLIASR